MHFFSKTKALCAAITLSAPLAAYAQVPLAAEQQMVCAAAMQSLFGKPYQFARRVVIDGIEAQQFRRPDGVYETSCYLQGSVVIWRVDKSPSHTAPGRWRTHKLDEVIRWSRTADEVSITLDYPGEPGTPRAYSESMLKKSAKLPR